MTLNPEDPKTQEMLKQMAQRMTDEELQDALRQGVIDGALALEKGDIAGGLRAVYGLHFLSKEVDRRKGS